MKQTCFFTTILFFFATIFWSSVPTGCANIIPPAGGPRDTLPPLLLKADPGDSALNFNSEKIVFTFDELIDIKDIVNNVIWSPAFETSPPITVKGKVLTVNFEDHPLDSNTTYIVNFGKGIVDINESNPLEDFVYTFSTGPVMDFLELTGRVLLAETGGVDTTLIAILHKRFEDSAIINNRPPYAVRVDNDGFFRFRNLPKDTFALYVVHGDNNMRKAFNETQLFAFADEKVIPGESDSILLYAYRQKQTGSGQSGGTTRIPATDRRLKFTQATTGSQDLLSDYILNFSIPLRFLDTTKMQLSIDSLFTPANYTVDLDSTRKEMRIKSDWIENTNYNLVLDKEFAADTTGRQLLKTDTLFFTTKKRADYGKLILRFRNLDVAVKPVLQFLQNGQVVFSTPLNSPVYSNDLFQTGDYDLRILFDSNGNGIWDPGRFFGGDKRQPELVRPIERKITVKPAWENEMEILL